MARPLRTNIAGGWYHVTSRGQNRQAIFLDVADGANFMARVAEFPSRFGVEVHAFVLMPNHYHLLLRTPRGNLSRAVQWLNTGYGIWWNRRHQRTGHVYQGRFKSVLVEEGNWLLELSLYIHLNPVAVQRLEFDRRRRAEERTGAVEPTPEIVAQRLDALRAWKWSSYRAYVGQQEIPEWLTVKAVLPRAEGGSAGYQRLAEARLGADSPSPWSSVRAGSLLGSDEFVRKAAQGAAGGRERAQPAANAASWERIVEWVVARRGAPWEKLCDQRGEWGRELAWWAGRRYAELSLRRLGELTGGVDYATVAKAIERFDRSLAENPDRAAAARDLGRHLAAGKPRP